MDARKAAESVRELLKALDQVGPHTASTPERVAKLLQQRCGGTKDEAKEALLPIFECGENDLVIIKDLEFYSLCQHHLLPFFGLVHIAYEPEGGRVLGIGKVAKAVDILSRRLQTQEDFTNDIAQIIMEALKPQGILVLVEAQHLCMNIKREKRAKILTSKAFGALKAEASMLFKVLRNED